MDVFWGFEYDTEFFKIGDEIDVIFNDGTHYDGALENIYVDDNEIVVDGFVFELDRIKKVVRVVN